MFPEGLHSGGKLARLTVGLVQPAARRARLISKRMVVFLFMIFYYLIDVVFILAW